MSFAERLRAAPLAADPDRAARTLDELDPSLREGEVGALLGGTAGSSPYLARLIARHADDLPGLMATEPEKALADTLIDLRATIDGADSQRTVAEALRGAKSSAALLIALADLGGVWELEAVTGALTELADCACEAAAGWLLSRDVAAGHLPGTEGYVLLAMGKMGARELNYSSDIDLIALFDDGLLTRDDAVAAKARYVRLTRELVKLLSENTSDGYVFRTDLRLRPSPSTTPVCMAMSAAERYYESVGRTWERAAHIKARPLCDLQAGQRYLDDLSPFIWRRHLDFAAIEDIHAMLRMIREKKVHFTAGALPGHDLKLGPGGIREIEFFAQTRQLIMGGRNPALREPATLDALGVLADADLIASDTRDLLSEDYRELRRIEHRLQMMEDAQTHSVPKPRDARRRLAMLAGFDALEGFETDLTRRLARVNKATGEFFGSTSGSSPQRPSPVADLAEAGFERPDDAKRQIARWRDGGIAATRTARAQELFRGLETQVINGLSRAVSPDQALVHFDRFLSGLPAGVQVLSLFSANPRLLDLIVAICATSPRLAAYLGRRPQTLDALLDRNFWQPVEDAPALGKQLEARLAQFDDYERVLDEIRRWAREVQFRAGVHVLQALADEKEAGGTFTAIAETALASLMPRVEEEFAHRHGRITGGGLAVLAMGKLGSTEMTAGSDLDLILIYDAAGTEASDGAKSLPTRTYYTRLTQALVAALTAPTAEGVLYDVDMRLRPSGRQGPVAISIDAFESYQTSEAWVWEHLALTRGRPLVGPEGLRRRLESIIAAALAPRVGSPEVVRQAREMRAKLMANAPSAEPWALKHGPGGLMDLEFCVQTGALFHGLRTTGPSDSTITRLAETEWLSGKDAEVMQKAWRLFARLQQIERVALDQSFAQSTIGAELREALLKATGFPDFEELTAELELLRKEVATICDRKLGNED